VTAITEDFVRRDQSSYLTLPSRFCRQAFDSDRRHRPFES
jgi:hypothetical protein